VPMQWLRSLVAFAALALALLLGADDADARLDGELKPASVAAPGFILVSNDHPATAGQAPSSASNSVPGPGSLGGLFNRHGLIGGFAAGFLGSGLLGLMFGHGMIGELGSMASFVGLACQLVLIVMLGWLIWSWWTGRNQPAFSGLSPRQLADPYLRTRHELVPSFDPLTDADDGSGADGKHSASV
jgi:predicted lipid-binding transport protein (Tim44 family)